MGEVIDFNEEVKKREEKKLVCMACGGPLKDQYYLANGQPACQNCSRGMAEYLNAKGRFLRALIFGLGGALLAAGLWAAVVIMTGWNIGLIAILVGIIVGKAVSMGSACSGGRAFQFMAVALTFISLCWSTLPILINEVFKARNQEKAQVAQQSTTASDSAPLPDNTDTDAASTSGIPMEAIFMFFTLLPVQIYISILTNDPGTSIFLLIALYEAWKINGKPDISIQGPIVMRDSEMDLDTVE